MSDEDYDDLTARFPAAFVQKTHRAASVPLGEVMTEWGPLDASRMEAAQAHIDAGSPPLGVEPVELKQVRRTHHRAAQLLAAGMDETRVALMCNYTPMRISHLRRSPAFAELEAFYSGAVDEEFGDFVSAAALLSQDILQEIQRRLDEEPEKLSPSMLNEFLKTLADRSGNAPVQRSLNFNVNTGLGDKLNAARARALAAVASSQSGD